MVGLFQLLIFVCSVSIILSANDEIWRKPLPWELRLSPECKEEAQVVCKECGWAQCVPIKDDKVVEFDWDHECCTNVRKDHKAYCCPLGYEFKCCAMLPHQKYALQPKDIESTIKQVGVQCNSKICICDVSSNALMGGVCCDPTTACDCCKTPVHDLAAMASCKDQITAKALDKKKAMCLKERGTPATDCCAKNNKLVFVDMDKDFATDNQQQFVNVKGKRDPPNDYCVEDMDAQYKGRLTEVCVYTPGAYASDCCNDNYTFVLAKPHPNDWWDEAPLDSCTKHSTIDWKTREYDRLVYVNNSNWEYTLNKWNQPWSGQECTNQIDQQSQTELGPYCVWTEGWTASKCCPKNYQLKFRDQNHHLKKWLENCESDHNSKEQLPFACYVYPGEEEEWRKSCARKVEETRKEEEKKELDFKCSNDNFKEARESCERRENVESKCANFEVWRERCKKRIEEYKDCGRHYLDAWRELCEQKKDKKKKCYEETQSVQNDRCYLKEYAAFEEHMHLNCNNDYLPFAQRLLENMHLCADSTGFGQ
uniref:VWFD domain-containing protein n=1 Tax=Globodera pallida TaxID=36090 RepID=A0A183C577_GLOPA